MTARRSLPSHRSLLATALVAVLAAVSLSACTGGGRDGGDGSSGNGDRGSGGSKPQKGGTLRLGLGGLGSLDPAQARSPEQLLVADQLFDGLTRWDPRTLEPQPSLAARFESGDQKTWQFFLKPDITFANGRPITSADVKFSLERILRKDVSSPFADLLQTITNAGAFAGGAVGDVSGIATPAPDVVAITLDQPWSALPSVLGNPGFGIVPREAVESPSPAFAEQPVGSGPFSIEKRDASTVTLKPSPGSTAFVEHLELKVFDDTAAAYAAFVAGDVDWTRVPPEEGESARRKYGGDGFVPYVAELFYAFNLRNPKFADVRFREAIVRAVDRRALVRAVYGDAVRPIDSLVVSGIPGAQDGACGERCTHDVERAKQLIAEVFPNGGVPEIAIDFDDDPTQAAVANAIKADLGEVGIPATLRPKPLKEYQDFAVSGGQELFRLGWIAAYPSPDAVLPDLFASRFPSNLAGLSVQAVDDQLNAARAEADPAKRAELYRSAERAVLEQLPVIPIAQFELLTVGAGHVQDLRLNAVGTFDAAAVWLSKR